jgi:ATP-binding cassette, subfamily B, multidrug efflux pump
MQAGSAVRDIATNVCDVVVWVGIHWAGAIVLFLAADWRLTIPLGIWLALYLLALWYFVPRIERLSNAVSDARSMITGRVVDSYTNIATVKLFAHTSLEDDYAEEAMGEHLKKYRAQLRLNTLMEVVLWSLNSALLLSVSAMVLWLWSISAVSIGAMAVATGLAIRLMNMSGWFMWMLSGIFENIGTVHESMESIAQPLGLVDAPDAKPLVVSKGAIAFEGLKFHYGREAGVIGDLTLSIAAGEKVGIVGRSGAGKSTLVNLLLRFYDIEGGRILIDGQDISKVTQESLRAHIGMVTQDTSLLHRSVLDNILYGRPEASEAEAMQAATRAQSHEFIQGLADHRGRTAYAAHVGERGVKLSGGQRQRLAIARVLLKDAPILVLDEATSALDSEVEAAVQEQLYNLMTGKTVLAIAHRLSTIAAMDRLVIMDKGAIVEMGTHTDLLALGGLYASLWERQSGAFLVAPEPQEEVQREAAE